MYLYYYIILQKSQTNEFKSKLRGFEPQFWGSRIHIQSTQLMLSTAVSTQEQQRLSSPAGHFSITSANPLIFFINGI